MLLAAALLTLAGCGGDPLVCTEIGCESTIVLDYGGLVVNEPYSLTITASGPSLSVICLDNDPDAEPLPDGLTCGAGGFELTGGLADGATTVSVAVVPISTGEALVPYALVPLVVDDLIQPNGPDCEPVCYRRVGSVPPSGGPGSEP